MLLRNVFKTVSLFMMLFYKVLSGESNDTLAQQSLPDHLRWGREWLVSEGAHRFSSRLKSKSKQADMDRVVFCQNVPDDPLTKNNLFSDGYFQNNTLGWNAHENGNFNHTIHEHIHVLHSFSRNSHSAGLSMKKRLYEGHYHLSVWAKLKYGSPQPMRLGLANSNQINLGSENSTRQNLDSILTVGSGEVKSECWTKIEAGFQISEPNDAVLLFHGPKKGVDFFLTSLSLKIVDMRKWRRDQDARINKYRKREIRILFVDRRGNPVKQLLYIKQVKTDFPFGAAMSGAIINNRSFQRWFGSRFNWATFENEVKWYYNEGVQGLLNYFHSDKMTNLCKKLKIKIRGHNVLWTDPNRVQTWVKKLNSNQLFNAMNSRINSVVKRYKGRFRHWDVNNEMLHGNFFRSRLGNSIESYIFRRVRQIDSKVRLFVNEYNTVEYYQDPLSTPEKYLQKIYQLQSQGADIGGVGLQGHFYAANPIRIRTELNAMSVAKLPLWITELDVKVQDPIKQAQVFEAVMREVFSHPGIAGIVQWEVARPPCSQWKYIDSSKCTTPCTTCFVDENWRDRPIGKKYMQLRKEWSTSVTRYPNKDGRMTFRAFFGTYRVRAVVNNKKYDAYFNVPFGAYPHSIVVRMPF